jgi:hypothetical protein
MPALAGVTVADAPAGWAAAGFTVAGDRVRVGAVEITLAGTAPAEQGIENWTFTADEPGPDPLEGLATRWTRTVPAGPPPAHPNTAAVLDHIVVRTPDTDRTSEAFAAAGLDLRRVRPVPGRGPGSGRGGSELVQVFFRTGEVIVELVGPAAAGTPGPASFYGLAFPVDDIDATAALLGDHLSEVRAAVQPGRRIATLRHRALGLSVPVAFLSRREDAGTVRSKATTT